MVADEVHLWTTPELHRLYATITRNITKRKIADGWMMVTSTMYAPGEGSVAESIHAAAKGRKMPGLLWDHREAPADVDITDDEEAPRGARIRLRGGGIVDQHRRNHRKRVPRSDQIRGRQPPLLAEPAGQAGRSALRSLQHKALERPGLRPTDGTAHRDGLRRVGEPRLDGADRVDDRQRSPTGSPSACGSGPKGVGYDDWHIPRVEVDAAVYRAFRDFKVKYMVCDPAYWQSELSGWDREFGEDVVVKTNTRDNRIMVEAVQRYTVALAEGRFTHDGDPDVQKHIDNMAPRDTRAGIVPIKATRNEKIDAGMATLLGFWGLSQVPPPKPRPRIICLLPSMPKCAPRGTSDGLLRGQVRHDHQSHPGAGPGARLDVGSSRRGVATGVACRRSGCSTSSLDLERLASKVAESVSLSQNDAERTINVMEAAEILNKTPQAVTADVRKGRLDGVLVRGRYEITASSVARRKAEQERRHEV